MLDKSRVSNPVRIMAVPYWLDKKIKAYDKGIANLLDNNSTNEKPLLQYLTKEEVLDLYLTDMYYKYDLRFDGFYREHRYNQPYFEQPYYIVGELYSEEEVQSRSLSISSAFEIDTGFYKDVETCKVESVGSDIVYITLGPDFNKIGLGSTRTKHQHKMEVLKVLWSLYTEKDISFFLLSPELENTIRVAVQAS